MKARELWIAAAALLLWLAATAGLRLLALPDEGRYVGVAWEMLRSGDWLTPTLDGMPFFHKPPLFYWITAGALKLLGLHPFAGRAASLLGATLGGFALYAFVRRWCDERLARRAVALLAVLPLFYVGAQFANLDMLVAGCISATILLLADAALRLEQGLHAASRSLLGAYAMAALVSVGLVVGLTVHPLRNSRALAAALSAHAQGGEPLVMLKQYAYDLPFYARLRAPVAVVDDWSSPEVQAKDNWRKELADASRFAPAADAQLIGAAELRPRLCQAPVSFVLGEAAERGRWPELAAAEPLATVRGTTLWRLDAKALDCAGTPSAGSASR